MFSKFCHNFLLKSLIIIILIFSIYNFYGKDKIPGKKSIKAEKNYKISVKKNINTVIKSDILRFTKDKKYKIIELVYDETILENKGTSQEKVCICMANAFRAAQIAQAAWSDGIFRTGDIKEIKTGWNTDGIYELFVEFMEIPEEKIKILGKHGKKAASGNELSIYDLWYEFTFVNGEKLLVEADLSNRILSEKFLEHRSKFKKGDKSNKTEFIKERKIVVTNMAALPFKSLIIKK